MKGFPAIYFAILLSGCAIVPVELLPQKYEAKDDLHALLENAVAKPDTEESKEALAHFISRWKENSMGVSGMVASTSADRAIKYKVTFSTELPGSYPPGYFDQSLPAEDFNIRMMPHHRRGGTGTTLMALRENPQREVSDILEATGVA